MKKTCPRCSTPFDCREDHIQSCSCNNVKLEPGVIQYIKESYGECLCDACLQMTNTYFYAFSVNPKHLKSKIK